MAMPGDTVERQLEREACAQHADAQSQELGKPMDWQHDVNPDYAKGWYECALTIADEIRARTKRVASGTEKL